MLYPSDFLSGNSPPVASVGAIPILKRVEGVHFGLRQFFLPFSAPPTPDHIPALLLAPVNGMGKSARVQVVVLHGITVVLP